MSHRIGLVLDFGGVLTTPLLPAVLAFEKREGLAEGACLTALYLDEEGTRLTHALERGRSPRTGGTGPRRYGSGWPRRT